MESWTQEIRSSMSQLSALKAVESIKITQTKLRLHFPYTVLFTLVIL
jgi:hypothetical protein